MSNLKFKFQYIFLGHEKTHINYIFISMLVNKEKERDNYKMEVIIRKGGS
jgi:hypothetical protein